MTTGKIKKEITIKELAKKFYEIMKSSSGFVNCFYLHAGLEEKGYDLKRNPWQLWHIWRQVEEDFPASIKFVPQNPVTWSLNCGWLYVGVPQYELKGRRKRRIED